MPWMSATVRAVADDPSRGEKPRRWFSFAASALAIVLAVPFFLVDVPPVLDYPNHLARYFVLAHRDDPIVSQMYATRWTILPNLGMDVVGAALLRITDVHLGGRILLALSLFAPVVGVVLYHRVVFGGYSCGALASGLLAYNGAFFLGLMNFLLSLGLALIAGAAWIALRRRNMLVAPIVCGAIAATLIFFCHIFGVLMFAMLIGAYEVDLLWKRGNSGAFAAGDVACALGGVAAALSPAVALYLLSSLGTTAVSVGEWLLVPKLWRIFTPFMTTSAEFTLLTGVAVVALLILFRRRLEFAPGLPLALAGLVVAFIAAPSSLKGGTFVDLRLALMIGLLLFAGVKPHVTVREAALAGLVIGSFILLRSFHVGTTWTNHRHDLADVRAAIAKVHPGARVLAARGHPGHLTNVAPAGRSLPGVYRLDGHLAALLVMERKAFWPLLFADPAQQPVAVKPPFDRIAQPLSEPVEWQWLAGGLPVEALGGPRYLERWQRNFDYVLLIDPPATVQPHSDLSPLYRGSYAHLYRVDRREVRPSASSPGAQDLRGTIADPPAGN
jgi:hypothetical protein